MTGEIENLIDELPQASNQRVEEIATILEGVLSDIECKFPTEDDSDSAYECQNIPKAKELIVLVRAWEVRVGELKAGDNKGKDRERRKINKLSKKLKLTFSQI
jgi:hypothetical protein